MRHIITIGLICLLISCNYENDFNYIKRHTGIYFPENKVKIISFNNNLENYVTGLVKISKNQLEIFKSKNSIYNVDCENVNFSEALHNIQFRHLLSKVSTCYGSISNKNWRMKLIDKEGYVFIEIWY